MRNQLLILMTLLTALGGCGDSADGEAGAAETPEQIARENARIAETALRDSDAGVDESGDRVWKEDARRFFDFDRYSSNCTFELNADWAREFVEAAYAAGAEKIWVTTISEFEWGGTTMNISDNMVVDLPADTDKRTAIFTLYNNALESAGQEPLADVGQDFFFITGD